MTSINLTTRKKNPLPVALRSTVYDRDSNTYEVRFSEAYRPAGHDYTQSFKVLRLAYWLKYHLLTQADIALYETLQLLCDQGIPFTLDRLAEEMAVGKSTLRQQLDNLENAELLEIRKSDGQGQPNFYILRTPYFERDSIVGDSPAHIGRLNRIERSGGEPPVLFLEDVVDDLRRKIRKNRAKKLRHLAALKKRSPKLYRRLAAEIEERRFRFNQIVKKLGEQGAVDLDAYIWRLSRHGIGEVETTEFNLMLRERIRGYFGRARVAVDQWLLDAAAGLFYFYSPQLVPAIGPAAGKRTAVRKPVAAKAASNEGQKEARPSKLTPPAISKEDAAIWQAVTAAIIKQGGEPARGWLELVVPAGFDRTTQTLRLIAANEQTAQWIDDVYRKVIVETLGRLRFTAAAIEWSMPRKE